MRLGCRFVFNKPKEQDHSKATFTKKFSTEDGRVYLPSSVIASPALRGAAIQDRLLRVARNDKTKKDSAESIFNKIRALNPDPGVFTFIKTKTGEKRVKLLEAKLNPTHTDVYGTKDDKLELLKVQPEGKKPMPFKDFQNGLKK